MSNITNMGKALRKATKNTSASDEFMDALEKRETQREEILRETIRESVSQLTKEVNFIKWLVLVAMAWVGIVFTLSSLAPFFQRIFFQ